METEQKKLPFAARPEQLAGVYCNSVVITHSPNEFVLDFLSQMPTMEVPQLCSRIVVTPDHAKRLLAALAQNVQNYEKDYGEIVVRRPLQQVPLRNTFNGPKGDA